MSRTQWITSWSLGLILSLSACTNDTSNDPPWGLVSKDPRPDIVLVVADDMRWDLLSARGHEFLKTPNMDALLSEGANMDNAFVPIALCSPSRAAILTGRHAHKASAPQIAWRNNSFLHTQRTFAEELQAAGYTTAYVGKWHLGDGHKPKRGFDHWESFDWLGSFNDPDVHVNGKKIRFRGYTDDVLAQRAADVIEHYSQSVKPVFLMVGLKAPHLPFSHPQRHDDALENVSIPKPATYDEDFSQSGKLDEIKDWLGMDNFHCGLNCFEDSWDKYIKSHYRAILGLDDSIGTIRGAVQTWLKPDNSLFIYTSDNGYSLGDHGLTEKHFVYEEPIRVPMMIDAPGQTDAGVSRQELVSTVDLAPTILDYAGARIPNRMVGKSLRPLIESSGSALDAWRDQLFLMYEKAQVAVRTDDYKLIKSLTTDNHYELYDLVNDPKETTNVYANVEYNEVRRLMRRRLKSIIHDSDWSPRQLFSVSKALVSTPVATADAARLASLYSKEQITVGANDTQGVSWREGTAENGPEADRFDLLGADQVQSGTSVLVAIPIELRTDWDPYVGLTLRPRATATMYVGGQEVWSNVGDKLPLNTANPPLSQGLNQVILRFDDLSTTDVGIQLETMSDTLRLPLAAADLGDSPARFQAVDSWQPHNSSDLNKTAGSLSWIALDAFSQIQTEDVYVDEPVSLLLRYRSDGDDTARLYWRSDKESWNLDRSAEFDISAQGGLVEQVVQISPDGEIDALRMELSESGSTVSIDYLSINSLDGKMLHEWDFQ